MYPNLYYAFKDFFGVEWNWLKVFNSFGFFVALAFIGAAATLTSELRRKQSKELFTFTEQTIVVGGPASLAELLTNFILGFILGFKILGVLTIPDALNDPQSFILSLRGNFPLGILFGLIFAGLKWWEKHKEKLPMPEKRVIRIWPHDRVGDVVIFAAVFGFAGAKIFNSLENWNDFVANPVESLISFSGLTFYGGLICAALAIYYYAKKHKIPFIHLCDANAPGLMLAYAIGRIGCQVSGDGDWGILNSALISNSQAKLVAATPGQFNNLLQSNKGFYAQQFATFENIQYLHVKPFWGLPDWFFGYNFPHNVINEGLPIAGCDGNYCHYLPISVFPTSFYETVVCLILFGIIWFLRKKINIAGRVFAIYLVLNGIERFFIEKIRVNTKYDILFHPTQAEIISSLLVIVGILLYWYAPKLKTTTIAEETQPENALKHKP